MLAIRCLDQFPPLDSGLIPAFRSVGLSALSIALLCTGTLGILYSERLSTGSGDTQKGTGEDKVLIPDDATGASAAAVGARRKYVEGARRFERPFTSPFRPQLGPLSNFCGHVADGGGVRI